MLGERRERPHALGGARGRVLQQRLLETRDRDRRADAHADLGLDLDAQQVGHRAEVHQHLCLLLLVDADARVADDDARRRAVAREVLERLLERARAQPHVRRLRGAARAHERQTARVVVRRQEARELGALARGRLLLVAVLERLAAADEVLNVRVGRERLARVEDRTVARAATQVAVEAALDLLHRDLGRRSQRRVQGHHHAGRAEAALRAVKVGDALLDRMVSGARRPDALGGRHGPAVERRQRTQARVDRQMHLATTHGVDARQIDGTRATTTLAARELGALVASLSAQEAVERHIRIDRRCRQHELLAVDGESQLSFSLYTCHIDTQERGTDTHTSKQASERGQRSDWLQLRDREIERSRFSVLLPRAAGNIGPLDASNQPINRQYGRFMQRYQPNAITEHGGFDDGRRGLYSSVWFGVGVGVGVWYAH